MPLGLAKPALIGILCALAVPSSVDDYSGVQAFCERADAEFQSLMRSCKQDRRPYWDKRAQDAANQYADKSQELQQTSAMLARRPNGKELQAIFAFRYLKEISEVQLTGKTKLVEDPGRELVIDRTEQDLFPAIAKLQGQFEALKKKPSDRLPIAYTDLLAIKRLASALTDDAPIKYEYTFAPKANAFATNPDKIIKYTIHDWPAALAKVTELRHGLQPIEDAIESARFFSPKDPLPWLPIAAQLTFLMVAMGGWIKSYHGDSYFVIGLLVIPSMILSVFLVFYSDETLWNIARQSLFPSGFIVYWIAKRNYWPGRLRTALNGHKKKTTPSDPTGPA